MNIDGNKNREYPVNTIRSKTPAFKSGATSLLNLCGNTMQGIENQGFLASFLIQDFGGMTIPRTIAGFLRDKEQTGHYNKQEGFEVLGREGLTGPIMMAVAPVAMLAAAKFGHSTSVNSGLIKRFGNSLKEIVSAPNFDKSLLKDANQFKQEFYKTNINKILSDTLGKNNVKQQDIDYILQQINNIENIPSGVKLHKFNGKSKYKHECFDNIKNYIDDLKYSTSSELDMLQKVKVGSEKSDSIKSYATKDAIDAMIKYSNDAITANKHLDKLDEIAAESIKDKSLAKRLITNISTMFATLGVLSVLPKLYARSNTAPGARKKKVENNEQNNNSNNNITFEGKKPEKGILERIGKVLNKNKSDFVESELEYNGHNFTNTLMAGLSLFGLLGPRGYRAYKRAQVDEHTGKKDFTEVWEIGIRDMTSSLAVVFAVPMMTRGCVTSYEKHSGFVLMNKDRSKQSKLKTTLDLINPYSKAHVLSNAELNALYNKIDSQQKMLNFCDYINKNGGDLQKILSKSEHAHNVFNDNTVNLNSLKQLDKAEKNKKIKSVIENLDKSKADNIIKDLMKTVGKSKSNKITTFARGLNSVPAVLTTFFISPYILGWFIPRLTYKNTQRIHEKQDREREKMQKLKTSA